MPAVQALAEGRAGAFAVDTGNNTDIIIFDLWAKFNWLGDAPKSGGAMAGSSVGGALDLRKGSVRAFEIGGLSMGRQNVLFAGENMGSLSSRSEAGNIGDTILSRFKVTFDYRRELIFLAASPDRRASP